MIKLKQQSKQWKTDILLNNNVTPSWNKHPQKSIIESVHEIAMNP